MIFLDLDGVCCDFVSRTINILDKSEDEYLEWLKNSDDHPYDVLNSYIGMDTSGFWDWIYDQGHKYWEGMPVFDWFEYLYEELKKISEVKFLTSAPTSPTAHYGKALWIEKNVGRDALYDLIICPSPMKQYMAKEGRVLIDDTAKNIEQWNGMGGSAFHFPSLQFFHRHPTDLDIIQAIQFAKEHVHD